MRCRTSVYSFQVIKVITVIIGIRTKVALVKVIVILTMIVVESSREESARQAA